jgi:hypothetical protein
MAINADLNLVFPIRVDVREKQDPDFPNDPKKRIVEVVPLVWVYHTPISMDVFEANYRIIAQAKQEIYGQPDGYTYDSGPRIARLALLDVAKRDSIAFDTPNTGPTLLAEIVHSTMVMAPGPTGYDLVPLEQAVASQAIDIEEMKEAESAIVFFTLGYAMARKARRNDFAESIASIFRGSMTSLPATEFVVSLKTSIAPATSGASALSQVPS